MDTIVEGSYLFNIANYQSNADFNNTLARAKIEGFECIWQFVPTPNENVVCIVRLDIKESRKL